MDYMKLALVELGNMSERRAARLVDADCNGGVLPMFLTARGGLENGFMIAQYTAAALASENKVFAHPASADSIPTSANTEDHVSMGPIAVQHTENVIRNVETIVAIELLMAAQGVDFRRQEAGSQGASLGAGSAKAYELIREKVPFLQEDTPLEPYIEAVRKLVAEGEIKVAVEAELGLD